MSLRTPWCNASRSVTCWSWTTATRMPHATVVAARTTVPLPRMNRLGKISPREDDDCYRGTFVCMVRDVDINI